MWGTGWNLSLTPFGSPCNSQSGRAAPGIKLTILYSDFQTYLEKGCVTKKWTHATTQPLTANFISNITWQHQDGVGDVQVVCGHRPAGARPDHQTLSRERRDE